MRSVVLIVAITLSGCSQASPDPEPVVLPAEELSVEVPTDGLTLEGNLALPERVEGEGVPAIVLVHGSGPNSRDEVGAGQLNMSFGEIEIAAFADISAALSAEGLAVLRYDKRTCTSAGGYCDNDYPVPDTDVLVSDFASDALSAVAWLSAQEGIDPQRIFVVGHSQGAALMPTLLDGDSSLAGGVSLAGNYRPIDVILRYQLDFSEAAMVAAGYPQSVIDSQLADLVEMVEALESLRGGNFLGTIIAGMPVGFWQDWMAIGDARPGLVEAEDRPMLALNGDYDWNIPHDPELLLWGDAGVDTVLLPCVTHALNCVEGSEVGEEVDSDLLDALIDWLLLH